MRPKTLPTLLAAATFLSLPSLGLAQGTTYPILEWDVEVVSFEFVGSATLPLGPGGASISAVVSGTKAQDHNSSRSNKTASIAAPPEPDDVDPDTLDGVTFDLFSVLDLDFDLRFEVGSAGDQDLCPAGVCDAAPESPLQLDLDMPGSFVFDKAAPDFNMLGGSTRSLAYRGHVTVLKIAVGGGGPGSEVLVPVDGVAIATVPGTSKFSVTPTGTLRHSIGVSVDLTGTFNGQPFEAFGLEGVMIEEGAMSNPIIPEPAAMTLLGLLYLSAERLRRHGVFSTP